MQKKKKKKGEKKVGRSEKVGKTASLIHTRRPVILCRSPCQYTKGFVPIQSAFTPILGYRVKVAYDTIRGARLMSELFMAQMNYFQPDTCLHTSSYPGCNSLQPLGVLGQSGLLASTLPQATIYILTVSCTD